MDVSDLKGLFAEVKKRMDGHIEHVRRELGGVRTGRASVNLLDTVHVEAYGSLVPLKDGKRQHKSGRTNYFLFQSEPIPAQILDEGNPSLVLNANRFPCREGRIVPFPLARNPSGPHRS